jgi:hypothetical protein
MVSSLCDVDPPAECTLGREPGPTTRHASAFGKKAPRRREAKDVEFAYVRLRCDQRMIEIEAQVTA